MTEPPQCFKLGPWSWGSSWQDLIGRIAALWLGLGLCWAIYPASVGATNWYPVAEASQGQQRQFVDLDSVKSLDKGYVRVGSYYVDSRAGEPQRTDYLTEYDCDRRRFRDVEFNGPVGSQGWMPVDPDPLNSAAMEYVCAVAKSG
ncbi:hypothetical protein ACQ4N7_15795 [Nodosilinea sp. AN01ver1]|uniref:hypothetical protein n=1 Tax=Nodosilinea sp. AN01ver1 TaxID=3423362 RepID=UPI003D311B43